MTEPQPVAFPDVPGFAAWLGRTWLRLNGWSIAGGPPPVHRAVVIAAPHTTNWDLPYSLATAFALGISIRWVGKHTLFLPPFGFVLRKLGGIPVDRRSRNNAVKSIARLFDEHEQLLLLIPPEGTRSKATRWKSGFYYVALEAKVPIVMGFLDYGRRCSGLGDVVHPSGNIDEDMHAIRTFYAPIRGKFPALQGDITLREESSSVNASRAAGKQ